jgi:hypothetical protein
MSTIVKAGLLLLATSVVVVASQEEARTYVAQCVCGICSYLFG